MNIDSFGHGIWGVDILVNRKFVNFELGDHVQV